MDTDEQQEQQYLHHQHKYKFRKHNDLHPFMPSDLVSRGGSSISGRLGLHSNKLSSKLKVDTLTNNTNDAKLSSSIRSSKKCVSMTRLDQLAQPKKRIFTKPKIQTTSGVPSSSLTSSSPNATSVKNSLLKSSRASQQSAKLVQVDKLKASSPRKEVYTPKNNSKVNFKAATPRPREKSENKTDPLILQSPKEQKSKLQVQPIQQPELPDDDEPKKVSFSKRQSEQQEQNFHQSESKTEKSPETTPQVNQMQSTPHVKIVNSNFETPDTPTNKITNSTFDTGRKAFHLTSNNQASLWDELNGDTTNNKSLEPTVPTKPVSEVSVINDQVSDLSLNDRHYQSAASDLVQDSETSSNGVNYSKDLESLCLDLDAAGLIAGKMTHNLGQPETGNADKQLIETLRVFSPSDKELLKTLKEDEEKKTRAEEELKELAKREEQERQSRRSIVDSILSRVQNQSS